MTKITENNPRLERLRALYAQLSAVRYALDSDEDAEDAEVTLVTTDHFLADVCRGILAGHAGKIDASARAALGQTLVDASGRMWTLGVPPQQLDLTRWPRFLEIARLQEDVRLECVEVLGLK